MSVEQVDCDPTRRGRSLTRPRPRYGAIAVRADVMGQSPGVTGVPGSVVRHPNQGQGSGLPRTQMGRYGGCR